MRLFAKAKQGVPKLVGNGVGGDELVAKFGRDGLGLITQDDGDCAVQVEINLRNFAKQNVFVGEVVSQQRLLLHGLWLGLRGGGWGGRIGVSHDSASST